MVGRCCGHWSRSAALNSIPADPFQGQILCISDVSNMTFSNQGERTGWNRNGAKLKELQLQHLNVPPSSYHLSRTYETTLGLAPAWFSPHNNQFVHVSVELISLQCSLTRFQIFGTFVSLVFLGQAFTIMLVYVWSRRNPNVRMNFFGLLNFQAPFLPWVLMGFSLLLGNSIIVDLLGTYHCHPQSLFSTKGNDVVGGVQYE